MKKIFIAAAFLFVLSTTSYGSGTPLIKLERGVVNVVTAPVEIVKEFRTHWIKGSEKTSHISAWLFCGLVKGVVMTAARAGSGIWDIATFPVSVPKDYAPLLKPVYVYEEWPRRDPGVVYKSLGDK